jgi:hypothetical protein
MARCLVVVVLAAWVGCPAGAAAAGRWSRPLAVAHPARPAEVVDAVLCGGDAVVAWEDFDIVGTGRNTTTERFALWIASAAIGQPFGASQLLERTDVGPGAAVAASPGGWCAVTWQLGRTIRIALRPPGGTFGAPVTVTQALLAAPVRVGIDDGGSATVLWSEFETLPSLTGPVRTATVTPAGAVAIHDVGGEVLPGSWLALAVGAAGQAVAAWSGFPGPPGRGRSDARVALRPAGGQFGAATTFADPAANLYMAGASIDGAGRATVAVQRARHGPWTPVAGDPGGVEILQGSAEGGWGTPQGLDAGVQATNVRLVSNPRGDRAATWDVQPLNPREVGASRVGPAPAGQPFGPLLLTAMPVTADAIPDTSAGDVQTGAALDGAGETLVLRDGPSRGMQIHPVSPMAQAGPAEPLLANACAGGSGHLAVDPFSTVAAVAYHGRPDGLWIVYRDTGAPAPEAAPRICELRWSPALPGAHRAPAGPIRLFARLSKPTARLVVTVRDRHRRVLSSRRLGPRPVGYASLTLRGRHGAPTLPAGRYRVTATATDLAGRQSPATAIDLRVVRRHPRAQRKPVASGRGASGLAGRPPGGSSSL